MAIIKYIFRQFLICLAIVIITASVVYLSITDLVKRGKLDGVINSVFSKQSDTYEKELLKETHIVLPDHTLMNVYKKEDNAVAWSFFDQSKTEFSIGMMAYRESAAQALDWIDFYLKTFEPVGKNRKYVKQEPIILHSSMGNIQAFSIWMSEEAYGNQYYLKGYAGFLDVKNQKLQYFIFSDEGLGQKALSPGDAEGFLSNFVEMNN